jgi:solute carrier family 35, member E4
MHIWNSFRAEFLQVDIYAKTMSDVSLPARAAVVLVYLILNMSINLLNKFLISRTGFSFPILLTLAHMTFTLLALFPLMLTSEYRALHMPTLSNNKKGLAIVAGCFSANLAFNNYSLTLISLSLNQMIRACIPVVTVVCAVFIENYFPTRRELASLVAITVGICVVLAEDVSANVRGVCACVISTVANGIMMSMSGHLLQEKLDVWRLSFYQAPIVILTLMPAYLYWESSGVADFFGESARAKSCVAIVVLTCVIALAYNAIHGLVIKVTSATTTTVVGQIKIVLLLVLSAALLDEADFRNLRTFIGGAVAILGFTVYALERLRINSKPEAEKTGLQELNQNEKDAASYVPAKEAIITNPERERV